MRKWNEEAAPNNNLSQETIRSSKLLGNPNDQEFSEELSDGGERDQIIQRQIRNNIK
jgi:hypothetical protein